MNPRTRQILLATIALAAFGAAAYVMFGREKPAVPGNTVTLDGACLACRQLVTVEYPAAQRQPANCPKCGQRAVYGTFICGKCKIRFVPRLEQSSDGGPPRMPMIATCTVCGGLNACGYIRMDPEHQAAKLAPLPKWPP